MKNVFLCLSLIAAAACTRPAPGRSTAVLPTAETSTAPAPNTPVAAARTATTVPVSTVAATPPPTEPATAPASPTAVASSPQIVVSAADGSLRRQAVDLPPGAVEVSRLYTGYIPRGGFAGGTLYVLHGVTQTLAMAIDATGERPLSFIPPTPDFGLAVWPGLPATTGQAAVAPRLAWSVSQPAGQPTTELMTSSVDGSDARVLLHDDITPTQPTHLVALGWSYDGRTLYFSREPYGLGGYLLFAGASSLYAYHLDDASVTQLVPFDQIGGAFICLDDLAPDEVQVAEHCRNENNHLPIVDVGTGSTITVLPPEGLDFGLLGGARFSPDGLRVAFSLARNNPEAEQGWLAISDGFNGGSRVVATTDSGDYFSIIGWLNVDTLLFQSHSAEPRVWQVNVDGSGLKQVASGTFVGVLLGRR